MFRRTILSLALAAAFSGAAVAQCDPRFQIVNATDTLVAELHISSSGEAAWGPDLLGSGVLAPGQGAEVTPPAGGMYDMRVVMANSQQAELRQLNVCQISRVTVT